MKIVWTTAISATWLAACAVSSQVDPQTTLEIAQIASKVCTDKMGPKSSFDVQNWHVEEAGDTWAAWTDNANGPPKCENAVYISMADRMPDLLGCLTCVTAT